MWTASLLSFVSHRSGSSSPSSSRAGWRRAGVGTTRGWGTGSMSADQSLCECLRQRLELARHMAFVRRVHEGVKAGESLPQMIVNTYGVGDAPEGMVERARAVKAAMEVVNVEN